MKKEKHIYTEEELDEVRVWVLEREKFKQNHTLPTTSHWGTWFGLSLSAGLCAEFVCFLPGMAIWLWGNCYSSGFFKQFSIDNKQLTEGYTMFLPVSMIIVFFAILGIFSVLTWLSFLFGGEDRSKEEWMQEEIEKSEKMCDAALQEAEKPLKAEIKQLKDKLSKIKDERDIYQADKEISEDLLKQEKEELAKKLSQLQEEYSHEKRIWGLEKKELELELKQYKRK